MGGGPLSSSRSGASATSPAARSRRDWTSSSTAARPRSRPCAQVGRDEAPGSPRPSRAGCGGWSGAGTSRSRHHSPARTGRAAPAPRVAMPSTARTKVRTAASTTSRICMRTGKGPPRVTVCGRYFHPSLRPGQANSRRCCLGLASCGQDMTDRASARLAARSARAIEGATRGHQNRVMQRASPGGHAPLLVRRHRQPRSPFPLAGRGSALPCAGGRRQLLPASAPRSS